MCSAHRADAGADGEPGPDRYGELAAFLSTFYEVVLLDLGTGVAGPLARFAIERADQLVLVTTPEWVTSSVVSGRSRTFSTPHDGCDQSVDARLGRDRGDRGRFRAEHLHRTVTIPYDEQLATMLDSGTYTLDALGRPTRMAIKQLGLAVTEQLV